MNRALDLTAAAWRKSSYSDGGQTNCVECADNCPGTVPVRDSKLPNSPILVFGARTWTEFVRGVKASRAE
ncbi:DUF397 domain-containing protein [Streptomyces sp. bgisy032]|uniref:DUF397 domain-containing protein n=1 Tax=Streptomyces sp. bgisy032 TaxID=3413773 RepID=UPI003D70D9C2